MLTGSALPDRNLLARPLNNVIDALQGGGGGEVNLYVGCYAEFGTLLMVVVHWTCRKSDSPAVGKFVGVGQS